jgi:hypothetical protein
LEGPAESYLARVTGDFLPQNYPTQTELTLKKGARVMFVKNDTEKSRRWYNGSRATVTDLFDSSIELRVHETMSTVTVQRSVWETYKYFYDRKKDQLDCLTVGEFEQFPLSLAWATTIHKSQGKTLSAIYLDLQAGFRVLPSQLYVALSRTSSLKNVAISREVSLSDVQVNKRALKAWKFITEHDGKLAKLSIPEEASFVSNAVGTNSSLRCPAGDHAKVVQEVLQKGGRLYMDYISKTGRKWRVVKPKAWLQEGALFEAYCEENEEDRSFRIDRIHEMKVL